MTLGFSGPAIVHGVQCCRETPLGDYREVFAANSRAEKGHAQGEGAHFPQVAGLQRAALELPEDPAAEPEPEPAAAQHAAIAAAAATAAAAHLEQLSHQHPLDQSQPQRSQQTGLAAGQPVLRAPAAAAVHLKRPEHQAALHRENEGGLHAPASEQGEPGRVHHGPGSAHPDRNSDVLSMRWTR